MRLNLIFTVRNIHMETLETLTKSNSTCGSTEFKDVIPSKNDHKHHSNQHENSHKLQNKKGQPLLSLKESQWKLRQQHDQNFLWKKNYCRKKYQRQKKQTNLMSRAVRVKGSDSSRKLNHLSKAIRDRKTLAALTKSISSTRIGYPVF